MMIPDFAHSIEDYSGPSLRVGADAPEAAVVGKTGGVARPATRAMDVEARVIARSKPKYNDQAK